METALHQRNMRVHLVAALWVGLLGSAVSLTVGERLALVLCVFLVLSAEVANSALEALVDLVTRERHELARVAKDAGAGAVLVLACGAVAVLALVLAHAAPALLAGRGALGRQLALGIPATVAMAGLLAGRRWGGAAQGALVALGALPLLAAATRSVDPVFTALAGAAFVVAIAVARARR